MTASLMHEPVDQPELPVVPVTAEAFDAFARTPGAGPIEIDPDGVLVVVLRNVEYITAPAEGAA